MRILRPQEIFLLRMGRPAIPANEGGGSAPAQDPNVGIAALKSAELGEKWFQFAEQAYNENKPRQAAMDELTKKVTEQGLASSQFQDAQAREMWARYKDKVVPLEDKMFAEAGEYGNAADQERQAAQAGASVAQQVGAAKQSNAREMAKYGINPNSVKFQSVAGETALLGALGEASAGNAARDMAREKGIVMRQNAASVGRGLPATAQATFGGSQNAAGGAIGAASAGISTAAQGNGIMNQGFSGAMSGYGQQANILNADYRNRLSAWQTEEESGSGMWTAAGGLAGAAIMASDPRLKTDIVPVGKLKNGLTVYEYEYTFTPGRRRGVMADEVLDFSPNAVVALDNGYLAVDYSQLGDDALALAH